MKPEDLQLDEETQMAIDFLSAWKNLSAADTIREAVLEMYHREMERLPGLRLGDDGVLYLREKPVIRCSDNLLMELPENLLLRLEHGTARMDEVLLYLILNATRTREGLEIDYLTLKQEIGFPLDDQEENDEEEGRG